MTMGQRSRWVYLGIGCGTLAVLCLVGVVAVFYLISRSDVVRRMSDPQEQQRSMKELLGTGELPESYHLFMVFPTSLGSVVHITTGLADPKGVTHDWGERGFLYARTPASVVQERKIDAYVEGLTSSPGLLEGFLGGGRLGDLVEKGKLTLPGGAVVSYASRRADFSRMGGAVRVIATGIKIECTEQTSSLRTGLWYTPDPGKPSTVVHSDIASDLTVEQPLAQFLSSFKLCPSEGETPR